MRRSVLVLAVVLLWAVPAYGAVKICLLFDGPSLRRMAGYKRLIIDEIRHHRSHKYVERGCSAVLHLEYIRLDKGGYLTGRIGDGIPHRVKLADPKEIPDKIRKVIAVLLKNEPTYLVENMATSGLLKRRPQSLTKHGHNLYGVEVFHNWLRTDRSFLSLSGAAFRFRRAVDLWFVGARASFAYFPGKIPQAIRGHAIRYLGSGGVEVGVNFFPHSFASLYLSGLVGVQFMQVYGAPAHSPDERDSVTSALAFFSLRLGVEILRYYSVRVDLFGMFNLPFHKTRDIDSLIIDAYTPSFAAGCGVAF